MDCWNPGEEGGYLSGVHSVGTLYTSLYMFRLTTMKEYLLQVSRAVASIHCRPFRKILPEFLKLQGRCAHLS